MTTQLEKTLAALKGLATRYPVESEEHRALRTAALGLIYIASKHLQYDWDDFVAKVADRLVQKEQKKLRDLGLD